MDKLDLQRRFDELKLGFILLTCLPVSQTVPLGGGELARALWCAPIVGVVVGLAGAAVYAVAVAAHLPPLLTATLAVAATVLVTGALHEDGLADVADGFGGGASVSRKLEIMRDSRIGTYGVCALLLSFILRIGALTNIGDTATVTAVLVAAHAAARAPLLAFMRMVQPARADGMSASAGRPPLESALVAMGLGALVLLLVFGFSLALVAIALLAVAFGFLAWLCKRQIGGQTGDVLGALEQGGEIIVLLVAAAAANVLR